MTCYDCINCDKCPTGLACSANPTCGMFKPKSSFVELPCELGQTVYYIAYGRMYASKVAEITVVPCEEIKFAMRCYGGVCFDLRDFGKTVFLSREEAEKALAERSK